jgi:hypothetical protein
VRKCGTDSKNAVGENQPLRGCGLKKGILMTKRPFKKESGPFFILPKEITSGKYRLHGKLIETKLSEYLGTEAIIVYILIGNKKSGEPKHDENLICISDDAAHLMSRPTFSKGLFRCWAYRLVAVLEWGGGRRRQHSRYQLIKKWRTLIRMPDRLERIHKLVLEYEKIQRLKSNPSNNKRQRLENIKAKIRRIIV